MIGKLGFARMLPRASYQEQAVAHRANLKAHGLSTAAFDEGLRQEKRRSTRCRGQLKKIYRDRRLAQRDLRRRVPAPRAAQPNTRSRVFAGRSPRHHRPASKLAGDDGDGDGDEAGKRRAAPKTCSSPSPRFGVVKFYTAAVVS